MIKQVKYLKIIKNFRIFEINFKKFEKNIY